MLVITLLDRSHSITEDKDAGKRPLSANKQQRREKGKNLDGFVVRLDYFMLSSQCGLFLENASLYYSFHAAPSVNWFLHTSQCGLFHPSQCGLFHTSQCWLFHARVSGNCL